MGWGAGESCGRFGEEMEIVKVFFFVYYLDVYSGLVLSLLVRGF